MLTIRAMSNGKGYAANHLVHSDYYTEEQRVVGYWQGRGAAELGLVGEVRDEQFEAIRAGNHQDTEPLLVRRVWFVEDRDVAGIRADTLGARRPNRSTLR
jgi:TrwC relaxase